MDTDAEELEAERQRAQWAGWRIASISFGVALLALALAVILASVYLGGALN